MLIDKQTEFSSAQAITASAASTNYIDLNSVRNIGAGEPMYLVLHVTTAFTDASSDSTVTPSLETDSDSGFATALATIRTYDVFAALTAANTIRKYRLEPVTDAGPYKRYIRMYYTVANGNLSTGAISAFLLQDVQAWTAYAAGYTIQ